MIQKLSYFGIALILSTSASCEQGHKDHWTAFVYPDKDAIPSAEDAENFTIGNYPTKEACVAAADKRLAVYYSKTGIQGDYECGFKCTVRKDFGDLLVCKTNEK